MAYLLGHADGTQYSKWEAGKKLPSLQNTLKLSHILQIPVELLLVELYRNLGKEVEERQKSLPKEVQKRSNTEMLISEPNSQK